MAHVGDSRAVMSQKNGTIVLPLTNDHKPTDRFEKDRITKHGGELYQNNKIQSIDVNGKVVQPPVRVLPGRLAVSRAFGDCMAKLERYGGKPGCIIAEPEVTIVDITEDTDLIVMGSDGVYDQLTNQQIKSIINTRSQEFTTQMPRGTQLGTFQHVQACCGAAVNSIIKAAMDCESNDNLSVILLVFKNYQKLLCSFDPPIGTQVSKPIPQYLASLV